MKCLVVLAATTIVYQIVTANPPTHRSRGYFDRDHHHQGQEDPLIHRPWWGRDDHKPKPLRPSGPLKPSGLFDYYEAFGISHGGYSHGYDSSEEEHDINRSTGPSRTPGYGGLNWWRPPGPPTKKPFPTQPPNPEPIPTRPPYPEPIPTLAPNTGENDQKVPIFLVLCLQSCPVTPEYNPVCGSNNKTYENLGRLECEQNCGVEVALSKQTPCSNTDQVISGNSLIVEKQRACFRSCPVTGEYNPVCGSDNVTYDNPGRLECAQNCGVPVTLSSMSACSSLKPTTSTTSTESALTIAELTAACMRSCSVTSEFNPVCGTDNVTYSNVGSLECAQQCGIDVKLSRRTSCDSPVTGEHSINNNNNDIVTTEFDLVPTTTSTARPFVNTNGGSSLNSGNNNIGTNNDNFNISFNGNNGEIDSKRNVTALTTNGNDEHGDKKENNVCGCKGNINDNNKSEETDSEKDSEENSDTKARPNANGGNNKCKTNSSKPPSMNEVMACMQTCALTSESNPVCGTDFITYMNPGRLLCAQFCGVDVKVKKFAPCSSSGITNVHCLTPCTNPPVTEYPLPVTPPISSIEACMEACPASIEYKPVCGSNNITYRNLEKLQCARRCGIDVTLRRSTHCNAPVNPNDTLTIVQECILHCSVPQKYDPICGSDNVTYNNTGHLICARQCGLDIQVKQQYPCGTDPNVSPTPTSSTTTEKVPVINPSQNGLNFTIDPSILANIWSETTNTTSKDDDEDFELDQRVQDRKK